MNDVRYRARFSTESTVLKLRAMSSDDVRSQPPTALIQHRKHLDDVQTQRRSSFWNAWLKESA